MIVELLKKITAALEEQGFAYMLSGSLALNSYDIPRMTMDIDIVIELEEENIDRFLSIFGNDFYIHPKTVADEVKRRGMFNAIDNTSSLKLDFIVRKNTEYRRNEFERRKKIPIAGIDVWIVSPEDLILSKLEWIQVLQSEKQIGDIKNLLKLPGLDKAYIVDWSNRLNLNTYNLF